MRTLFPLLLLSFAAGACRCGPDTVTPVTVRVKNNARSPLWVDATDSRLGVSIQRRVNSEWFSFVEQPACECRSCDQVCGGCDCAQPISRVVRINAGQSVERTWEGFVQLESVGSCGFLAGPECLNEEIPAVDETFRAELCYALSVPVALQADAGVAVVGRISEDGRTCVTQEFTVSDGVVELSPSQGAACSAHSDCKGQEELCLDGQCTTACPTNNFPQPGTGWQFTIDEPDDQGFFSLAQNGDDRIYTGTGTVSSVRYDNAVMTLRLARSAGAAGVLQGAVYVQLPGTHAVSFNVNETVSVTLFDKSTAANFGQRAIVIRDAAGVLLLAADTAQRERVLDDAATAPFAVNTEGEIAGCAPTDCGKQLQSLTTFSHGAKQTIVDPGDAPRVVVNGAAYRLLNISNARYSNTVCPLEKFTAYAILNTREAP